jgi:hypothetical protein
MTNSLILYVGKPEAGQALAALAEQHNDYVYLPENMMQTLGMYITYFPHVTVIDMSVDYAQGVLEHLRSVDACPVILLTNQSIRDTALYTLWPDTSAEGVMEAVRQLHLDEVGSVSNGALRYA